MKHKTLLSIICLGTSLAFGAFHAADARNIAIDFDAAPSSGNNFGFAPSVAQELNLTDDGSTGAISLGFSINFGLGDFSNVFINENGIVSFGAPLTGVFSGASTLASLVGGAGQPVGVIAPYYANLTSQPGNGNLFDNVAPTSEIFYQRGSADLTINSVTNLYDFDDQIAAFRVTWNGLEGLGTPVFTQLYLYSQGAPGNFGVRFAYGTDSTSNFPAQGSLAGLALGSSTSEFTGPYGANSDFLFGFTGGSMTPVTRVPEPPVSALLLAAALALSLVRRRIATRIS